MKGLTYLYNSIRHPHRRDYLSMTAGIVAREERCRTYWKPHLQLTKMEINNFVAESTTPVDLYILGAGRLNDVDAEFLDTNCRSITFYDIDPTLRGLWQGAFPKLSSKKLLFSQTVDLTSSIDTWTAMIKEGARRGLTSDEICHLLSTLKVNPSNFIPPQTSAPRLVISLNILGQLGVYWRDRVHTTLAKNQKVYMTEEKELLLSITNALDQSVAQLEEAHLKLITEFEPQAALLLTDIYYHYYQSDRAEWQTESALSLGDLTTITSKLQSLGYKTSTQNSWLWHIAPQHIERTDYGEIHEVYTVVLSS